MKPPLRPDDEALRLETLRQYDLLDTLPESALDDLTALAAQICGTPISLISVVDDKRQWFKSKVGLAASEMPRDVSFCGHVILQRGLLIVPDAKQDERFADNPLVTGDPHIRFYAGAPLIAPDGQALGTLCIIDRVPRELDPSQQEALRVLSRQVMGQFELRRQARELAESEAKFSAAFHSSPVMLGLATVEGKLVEVNPAFCELTGYSRGEAIGKTFVELGLLGAPAREKMVAAITDAGGAVRDAELILRVRDGKLRHVLYSLKEISLHGVPHRLTTGVDITERKQAEQRLGQLNRTYAVLSDISQLIVREREPQAILGGACRIAVEKGGFLLACVGLTGAAGEPLKLAAQAGATPETPAVLDQILSASESGCAFTRRAVETGGHAVCNDIARDPLAASWREAALQRGYRSMVALPLTVAGRRAGTFNLYAGEEEFFDAEELRLLDELAMDIAFALEGCERERDRQHALAQVGASEASKRAVWESALDGIITMSHEGLILDFNPAAERIFGHRREAVLGRSMADVIVPPAFRERHARGLEHFLATGEGPILGEHIEVPALRADGSEFPAELTIVVVTGGPQPVFIGTVRDVTERQHALAQLRASDERFRDLAGTIQEVFWMTDPAKNQMLYISPAYEEIWGRTCESLYAAPQTWLDAIHSADRERVLQAAITKQTRGDYDETYRITRPDGSVRWIHDRAFPVHGAAGEVLRVVGTAEDITEHRQLEEQLRQSQKMDAFGQLAGGVAHDFNNILAVMMMQAQLSEMAVGLPLDVRKGLQIIRAAAERGANLTRQLLLFSHKQVMQPRDLDLNEVVTSLAKMLQRIIEENVRLQLHLNPTPLITHADAGMLDQVLMNLAINARDAMPDGGRLVIETTEKIVDKDYASLHLGATPGRYVCLGVSDSGSGIAPDVLPRIFEPFFTTKGPGKGTGLGLATLFSIVQQHRGWVKVESQPGRGTTFQVFLPASEVAAGHAAPAARPYPRGGTETILLVEDEPAIRLLTRAVLERAGYRVLEALDGVEARRIWEQHHATIKLLFTDVVMPGGVNGHELATQLLADNPMLRIVFTSGYSANITGRKFAFEEGQNFIQKPSTPQHLLETVRRCLDG